MYRALIVIMSLLPALAYSHRDHHHADQHHPEQAPIASVLQWQSSLQRFSAKGDPVDLDRARTALRSYRQSDALTTTEMLYLAAWTSQADHRFQDARAYADQITATAPGWAAVWLLRASLDLVAGNYAAARTACESLRNVPVAVRLGCLAQSLPEVTPARFRSVVSSLQMAAEQLVDANDWQAWLALIVGDLAMRAGLHTEAADHYRVALQLQPSVRAQVALAQTLLDLDAPEAALAQLPADSPALAVRVKRLVAGQHLGRASAADAQLIADLESQFSLWQQQGDVTHGREMAEFYLHVKDHPERALKILEASLAQQREHEDERLASEARLAVRTRHHLQLHTSGRELVRSLGYTGG